LQFFFLKILHWISDLQITRVKFTNKSIKRMYELLHAIVVCNVIESWVSSDNLEREGAAVRVSEVQIQNQGRNRNAINIDYLRRAALVWRSEGLIARDVIAVRTRETQRARVTSISRASKTNASEIWRAAGMPYRDVRMCFDLRRCCARETHVSASCVPSRCIRAQLDHERFAHRAPLNPSVLRRDRVGVGNPCWKSDKTTAFNEWIRAITRDIVRCKVQSYACLKKHWKTLENILKKFIFNKANPISRTFLFSHNVFASLKKEFSNTINVEWHDVN